MTNEEKLLLLQFIGQCNLMGIIARCPTERADNAVTRAFNSSVGLYIQLEKFLILRGDA